MRADKILVVAFIAVASVGAAACEGDDDDSAGEHDASRPDASAGLGGGAGVDSGPADVGGSDTAAPFDAAGSAGESRVDDDTAAADASDDAEPGEAEASSIVPDVALADDGTPSDGADAADEVNSDGSVGDTGPTLSDGGGTLRSCVEHCNADDDCARPSAARWSCNPMTHLCVSCYDDLICIAGASLWTMKTCTTDTNCFNCRADGGCDHFFGDYCVEVDHTGYCAFDAASTSCDDLPDPIEVKKLGSEDRVQVCSFAGSRCDLDRGYCVASCQRNAECTAAKGGKICDTASGRCQCASAADCGPGAPVCNPATRQCECGENDHCSVDGGRSLVCE